MLEGLTLNRPGLFVTATDTHVGKTVVSCALSMALRRQWPGVCLGVSKPFSSGCRRDREGLVNPDAEALAHFADCRAPLDVINPIRFKAPLAPAVAAEQMNQRIDWPGLRASFERLAGAHDALLIEGVGGLLVPLDPGDARCTVLSLMQAIGYPALIVARAGLGTLNHTAMTAALLREAGVPVAGIVINGFPVDAAEADPAATTNRQWLKHLTGLEILATVPALDAHRVAPDQGRLPADIVEAMAMQRWDRVMARPR